MPAVGHNNIFECIQIKVCPYLLRSFAVHTVTVPAPAVVSKLERGQESSLRALASMAKLASSVKGCYTDDDKAAYKARLELRSNVSSKSVAPPQSICDHLLRDERPRPTGQYSWRFARCPTCQEARSRTNSQPQLLRWLPPSRPCEDSSPPPLAWEVATHDARNESCFSLHLVWPHVLTAAL